MQLPPGIKKITARLPSCLIVGGAVRDWLLGETPKDFDMEVYGVPYNDLEQILGKIGNTDLVGKSFGIIKTTIDGETYDVSVPRTEKKTGDGHKGFSTEPDPFLPKEKAAARRDLTINAMGWDPKTQTLFDPFNGRADLENKVLRHSSPAFTEDPLRVLRCVQFAARFNMTLHPETALLCQEMAANNAFQELAKERVGEEFEKFLLKGKYHGAGLKTLKESGWDIFFPEISALYGLEQDEIYHPEGDVIIHTGHCLDALKNTELWKTANRETQITLATAVLCHDLGKATTTRKEWKEKEGRMAVTSKGHEETGAEPTRALMQKIGTPQDLQEAVVLLVTHHMAHIQGNGAKEARRLAMKLSPANPHAENARITTSLKMLGAVVEADHSGRPPLEKKMPEAMEALLQHAHKMGCLEGPIRPLLSGKDLSEAGIPPGKAFGVVLKKVYSHQVENNIQSKEEARTWLEKNKRKILAESGLGPKPLITGTTLLEAGVPKGPQLSQLSNKAYDLQLRGKISSKEEGLKILGIEPNMPL